LLCYDYVMEEKAFVIPLHESTAKPQAKMEQKNEQP
jgi:hypothetical protein